MDKITDRIYLGDCYGAKDEGKIKANNIKRVLSCMGYLSPKYKDKTIKQKIIELDDSPSTNIIQYFKDSLKFIDENNEKVFVHCFAGVSRSATLVIAYLMWKNRISYKAAYDLVNEHRFVGPNLGFTKQLLIFQQKLRDANYDLDKIDLSNITWPPPEGIPSFQEVYKDVI